MYNIVGDKMKNTKKYNLIISTIILIAVLAFSVYAVLYKRNVANFKLLAIDLGILVIISIVSLINQFRTKNENSNFSLLTSIIILFFGICTFFIIQGADSKKNLEEKVPNFVGKNISEAISWASKNNIELIQNYEYSDIVSEYVIFSQNVNDNINVKDVDSLTLTISSGFNYDKVVILPSFVGQNIDAFLNEMEMLHLNNVKIDYQLNDYNEHDIIISQSKTGEIRRNDEVKLVVSLGKKSELSDTNMPSLIKQDLFKAILYLEQNGINYEIKYDFSESPKNQVIAQSIKENEVIKPFDTKVILTISKGNKIIVPNLTKMTIDEVIRWISDNNLKISLSDAYNNKIEAGKIIKSNYKENDEISEGTVVEIVTSKGALKMPSFKSLNEFRTWANTYNIKYDEEYEFSTSVAQGNIIKFSLSPNDIIDETIPITVTISNGKSVKIPNFVGKTKTEIASSCKNIGLNCTFNYASYSQTAKDVATSQNKKAGSTVISGTSVIIYLSKGTAKTFTIEISESQLTIGNASATANTLKNYFAKNYPDVTFVFSYQKSNTYSRAGFIHENSPVNDGKKVTQGNTYKVIITQ